MSELDEVLKQRLAELDETANAAEQNGDKKAAEALLAEKEKVERQLAELASTIDSFRYS